MNTYSIKAATCFLLGGIVLLSACDRHHKSATPTTDIIAEHLDTTVNPGVDFFAYANGGWIKKNPIPAAYASWGVANLVVEEIREKIKTINENALKTNASKGSNTQKIGDFYYSGMDSLGIEKAGVSALKPELDRIDAIKDVNGILDEIARLHTQGEGVLFYSGAGQDSKKSDEIAFQFYQGGLGMPSRDYYLNTDSRTAKIRADYQQKFLPTLLTLSGLSKADAEQSAKSVYAIEKSLAEHSRKLEDLRDPYANYNKMAVTDFSKSTPLINWTELLAKMKVPHVDSVIIGQPEFFTNINAALTQFSIADWKAYLRFNVINTNASYLNTAIRTENFRFYGTVISGRTEQLPRWKQVLEEEENAMGEILGQLFVKDYFSEATKKRYEQMVDNVLEAYRERLKTLAWMSPETRAKALLKLNTVIKKVGYPDKWKDYSALSIDKSSYVMNIIRSKEWSYTENIKKLGKPVDRTEWGMTPQTYNAYYNPSNNEIVLPAAIFTIPGVRDEDMDDAVVYGYGGASTIGHEITHGFDDEGRQFDEKGNLKSWWTKEDEAQFNKRAEVMVNQFNGFVVLDSMHVNGKASLGENIADLGGVVLAYEAFKKTDQYKNGEKISNLSPAQRYYLGYALGWMSHQRDERLASQILTDVHAPANFRVNGPFANVSEFYEAFNIQEGSPMWRPDSLRVKIW